MCVTMQLAYTCSQVAELSRQLVALSVADPHLFLMDHLLSIPPVAALNGEKIYQVCMCACVFVCIIIMHVHIYVCVFQWIRVCVCACVLVCMQYIHMCMCVSASV